MLRGTDPLKLQEWRDRLERYRNSQQTVSEFCAEEQVSQPTFYQWKKRLGNGSVAKSNGHSAVPVKSSDSQRRIGRNSSSSRFTRKRGSSTGNLGNFHDQ